MSRSGFTDEILVWLANIRPETRCAVGIYGDFLDKATWMLAGLQSMKLASFLSLILCRDLWTCPGSTSPYIEEGTRYNIMIHVF